MNRRRIIAIDFDGTIVEDSWPAIGEVREGAFEVIQKLHDNGDAIIIWTCRIKESLKEAIAFLDENEVPYDAINSNVKEIKLDFNPTPKVYYDVLIDDRNYGPMPTWAEVEAELLG